MRTSRRQLLTGIATAAALVPASSAAGVERIVRFQRAGSTAFGLLDGDTIQPLEGTLSNYKPAGAKVKLADVRLLCPCEPGKMLAVGLNHESPLGQNIHAARA